MFTAIIIILTLLLFYCPTYCIYCIIGQSERSIPENYNTINEGSGEGQQGQALSNPLCDNSERSGTGDTPQVTFHEVLYDTVNERNTKDSGSRSTYGAAVYDEITLEEKNGQSGAVSTGAVYDKIKREEISGRSTCPAYEEVKESKPVYSQINRKKIKEETAHDNNDEDTTEPVYSQINKNRKTRQSEESFASPTDVINPACSKKKFEDDVENGYALACAEDDS